MEMDRRTAGEYALSVFRILVGWLFLWPFFDKVFGLGFQTPDGSGAVDGGSPSSFVIYVADGHFADFYVSIAGNAFVDFLFVTALLILGITLILGIASRLTTAGSILFFLVMYTLCIPPQDNPVIDYHIILCVGMVVVYCLGGFERLSLYGRWSELSLVRRFPILQ